MKYRILLADDEPMVRLGVRLMVEDLDLPVKVVAEVDDGNAAVAYLQAHNVDIIITDVCMPGMDGIQLSEWIYRQRPQIDVIILSGYGEFEYAQKAIKNRVKNYLLKPVQREQLRSALQELMEVQPKERILSEDACQQLADIAVRVLEGEADVLRRFAEQWEKEVSDLTTIQKMHAIEKIFVKVEAEIVQRDRLHFHIARPKPGVELDCQWVTTALLNAREFYCEEVRSTADGIIAEIRLLLLQNLNSEISIEEIARQLGYNASYLGSMFKAKTGKTISRYRNELRMLSAKRMLLETDLSITEIAVQVGYSDTSYFDRLFYKFYGDTPKNYRKKLNR